MKSHICWCVINYTMMVIDYQWLILKNKLPKVTILKVTSFWRFFKESQLLKWLVLKKLPRVTNFNLSHQMIINMWPWHEFQIPKKDWFLSWLTDFFHRVFVQYFLFQEKFIVQKLVLLFFFIHFFLMPKDSKD